MINNIKETKIEILDKCETFEGDRGYDDTKLIKELWDIYEIKPIIDIRNMQRSPDETKILKNYENVVYNYRGNFFVIALLLVVEEKCVQEDSKKRDTLKKLCPANQYGVRCKDMEKYMVKLFVLIYIIKIKEMVVFNNDLRKQIKFKKIQDIQTSYM